MVTDFWVVCALNRIICMFNTEFKGGPTEGTPHFHSSRCGDKKFLCDGLQSPLGSMAACACFYFYFLHIGLPWKAAWKCSAGRVSTSSLLAGTVKFGRPVTVFRIIRESSVCLRAQPLLSVAEDGLTGLFYQVSDHDWLVIMASLDMADGLLSNLGGFTGNFPFNGYFFNPFNRLT